MSFSRTIMYAASAVAMLAALPAAAADYTFTFAHVLTENTPNARAAVIFKEEVEKKLRRQN